MHNFKFVFYFSLLSFIFNSCTVPEDGISISLFSETIGDCEKITLFSDLNGDNKYSVDEPIVESFEICNGATGATGADGKDGADGVSLGVTTTILDNGCRLLTFYKDINLNGVRDDNEEVISTSNICNGENGMSIKAITSTTTDCENGGVKYSFYGDVNNNGVLDENESVINESVICNGENGRNGGRGASGAAGQDGADGADGTDGADGSPIGISIKDASSIQCPAGGLVFETFLDSDLDGIKDVGETTLNTTIKCTLFTELDSNGAPFLSLADNGVTIIASSSTSAGLTYFLNGVKYLVVDDSYMGTWTSADDASLWVTTKVNDMSQAFFGETSFNQDISSWDTSNVTTMNTMFNGATTFNQDIGKWDTSNVTTMADMFFQATSFNQDIGDWDTSSSIDLQYMFNQATAFNQDISDWDTSNVITMNLMFYQASLFNQNLSSWCVSNLTTRPTDFDNGATAWVLPKPLWGTCPQ